MAARDYILCGDCGVKLIYDGDDNAREWLEERYGDPSASTWTADIICPKCLAKLRAEVETLRRERDDFYMNYRMPLELENADLRQRVRELESALEAADEGRNYANQLLTEQSQRVRELEHQRDIYKESAENWKENLAALRKRIDDAQPVAWQQKAAAWLRGKAENQAITNERYPDHAKCYPSWVERVKTFHELANELEDLK